MIDNRPSSGIADVVFFYCHSEQKAGSSSSAEEHQRSGHGPVQPVVFAYANAGSKVVDYYMTWKGKQKAHRLKGAARKGDYLDEEFQTKRLSKLDEQWKRTSRQLDEEFKRLSYVPVLPLSNFF